MKKGILLLFLQMLFFCIGARAYAATLYMDPSLSDLKRGDTVTVSVRLDAGEGECVNVVDGVIKYTENIQPVDISRGSSIFSLWVEEPVINRENRTITFAGGIPNGYCGRIPGDPRLTNNVLDLQFQSPGLQIGNTESGNEVSIDFDPQTQVLLNDGFGTAAPTTFFGAKITLSKEAGGSVVNPWQDIIENDNISPEKFSITLEKTTNAFSDSYFIVFNTTDKQSGIDHYEVIEEPLSTKNLFGWGAETAPWKTDKSPYVLDDQSLNSTIRVKAIDKAGNEYIATYIPDENKRTFSFENKLIVASFAGGAVLLLILSLCAILLLRRRASKKEDENDKAQGIK